MDIRESCHPGVLDLAHELRISVVHTIGVVECLRLWCADYIPKGRIGKYSNSEIAEAVGINEGDDLSPDVLIAALCSTGWIAEDPTHRLIVRHMNWRRGARYIRWQRMKTAGGEISSRIRRFVFGRDDFRCVQCSATSDLTIDHIIAVSNGGTNALENLRTLCRSCNSRKKDRILEPGIA